VRLVAVSDLLAERARSLERFLEASAVSGLLLGAAVGEVFGRTEFLDASEFLEGDDGFSDGSVCRRSSSRLFRFISASSAEALLISACWCSVELKMNLQSKG